MVPARRPASQKVSPLDIYRISNRYLIFTGCIFNKAICDHLATFDIPTNEGADDDNEDEA